VKGKWTTDLNKWFAGKQAAYILEDNDETGRAHSAEVAGNLHDIVPDIRIVSFPELPAKGDVSDWIAGGGAKEQLLVRAQTAPRYQPPALHSVCAADVTMTAVEWLWPNRFAIGKLGIIAGLPDEGKGQVLCYIAARVTKAGAWPCDEGHAPRGNVILFSLPKSGPLRLIAFFRFT
jgi:hypothetical protein